MRYAGSCRCGSVGAREKHRQGDRQIERQTDKQTDKSIDVCECKLAQNKGQTLIDKSRPRQSERRDEHEKKDKVDCECKGRGERRRTRKWVELACLFVLIQIYAFRQTEKDRHTSGSNPAKDGSIVGCINAAQSLPL